MKKKNLYRKKLAKIIRQSYLEMDSLKSMTADEACERIRIISFQAVDKL